MMYIHAVDDKGDMLHPLFHEDTDNPVCILQSRDIQRRYNHCFLHTGNRMHKAAFDSCRCIQQDIIKLCFQLIHNDF